MPSGGMPASVTPRCSGTSGRCGGETPIDLDHLGRIGVLQRHAVAREAEPVRAARSAPGHCRASGRSSRPAANCSRLAGSTEPQFTPTRIAQSCSPADVDQKADLVLPGPLALVVVEVARVVADLVDAAGPPRPPGGSSPADRPTGWPGPAADLGQGPRRRRGVDGDPHHARPRPAARASTWATVASTSAGLRGAHALHDDRMAPTNGDRADANRARVDCGGAA